MNAGIAEILGIFLIVAGCCGLVGAAALVSTALGVGVAGGLLVLGGVLVVYVASLVDRNRKAAAVAASPGPR